MSLYDSPLMDQSVAAKQMRALRNFRGAAQGMLMQMKSVCEQGYGAIWSNPQGLTPQQAADALGTDAAEFLRFLGIVKSAANQIVAGTVTNQPATPVTNNPDGTIKIG